MPFDDCLRRELGELLASMGTAAFDVEAKRRVSDLVSQFDEARQIYLEHCQMQAMLQQSSLLSSFKDERLYADVRVGKPAGHETLSVVVPWSDQRFQFTSKHNTRPATGAIRVDDRTYDVGPDTDAFGCLDYGRGVWPYRTVWNWASASGRRDGRTIGLQLGDGAGHAAHRGHSQYPAAPPFPGGR